MSFNRRLELTLRHSGAHSLYFDKFPYLDGKRIDIRIGRPAIERSQQLAGGLAAASVNPYFGTERAQAGPISDDHVVGGPVTFLGDCPDPGNDPRRNMAISWSSAEYKTAGIRFSNDLRLSMPSSRNQICKGL